MAGSKYDYDANGNLSMDRLKKMRVTSHWSDMAETFTFYEDVDNDDPRTDWKSRVTMVYDAGGSRVLKTVEEKDAHNNPTVKNSTAYGLGGMVFEKNSATAPYILQKVDIAAPTGIEGTIDVVTDGTSFYLKDHLGSTRSVISEDGTCKEAIWYDSFGKQTQLHRSASKERKLFTGKELDREGAFTGSDLPGVNLYYFGARYYDADIGRFTSADPMEEFYDSYSYVGNNPINYTDPWGLNSTFNGGIEIVVVIIDGKADFEIVVVDENGSGSGGGSSGGGGNNSQGDNGGYINDGSGNGGGSTKTVTVTTTKVTKKDSNGEANKGEKTKGSDFTQKDDQVLTNIGHVNNAVSAGVNGFETEAEENHKKEKNKLKAKKKEIKEHKDKKPNNKKQKTDKKLGSKKKHRKKMKKLVGESADLNDVVTKTGKTVKIFKWLGRAGTGVNFLVGGLSAYGNIKNGNIKGAAKSLYRATFSYAGGALLGGLGSGAGPLGTLGGAYLGSEAGDFIGDKSFDFFFGKPEEVPAE